MASLLSSSHLECNHSLVKTEEATVCVMCGIVIEDQLIDYTTPEYNVYQDDPSSSSRVHYEQKTHYTHELKEQILNGELSTCSDFKNRKNSHFVQVSLDHVVSCQYSNTSSTTDSTAPDLSSSSAGVKTQTCSNSSSLIEKRVNKSQYAKYCQNIKDICQACSLPSIVHERAQELFLDTAIGNTSRNRNKRTLVPLLVASIYLVSKQEQFTRTISELLQTANNTLIGQDVEEQLDIPKFSKALKALQKSVHKNAQNASSTANNANQLEDFVRRKASTFFSNSKHIQQCANKALALYQRFPSRHPSTIASVAIQSFAQDINRDLGMKRVMEACGCSQQSAKRLLKELSSPSEKDPPQE